MAGKPRKPWVAVLLTFAAPGLGHVYTGEAKRGAILYLVGLVVFPLFSLSWSQKYYISALILLLVFCAVYLGYCLFDVVKISRMHRYSYELKKYNKWHYYLGVFVLLSLVTSPIAQSLMRSNFVKAYKIPAGSMMNTLLIGDHVLTDNHIYDKSDPQRGDIIVFPYPKNPEQDFVKRVVGVAGDIVVIKNKQLFINNDPYDDPYAINFEERIIPGRRNPRDNYGPITVPENSLFVLGDNRDNSHDSRFWGFVDQDKVKGKVVVIYWSWDSGNSRVRWSRIGKRIE